MTYFKTGYRTADRTDTRSANYRGMMVAELIVVSAPCEIPSGCLCTWVPTNQEWRLKYRSAMCPTKRIHG